MPLGKTILPKVAIPAAMPPNGPAGGSLYGTYPNPTIADLVVNTINVVDGAITPAKLDDNIHYGVSSVAGKTGVVTLASTDLTDTANLARLDAVNIFSVQNQQILSGGNSAQLNLRSDNIVLRANSYANCGDIGFSATGAYRDGGAIRCIGAGHLQLSTDYSTADTDLDLHNLLAANVRAAFKSSDGTAGASGTATILGLTSLTFKDGLYVSQA